MLLVTRTPWLDPGELGTFTCKFTRGSALSSLASALPPTGVAVTPVAVWSFLSTLPGWGWGHRIDIGGDEHQTLQSFVSPSVALP